MRKMLAFVAIGVFIVSVGSAVAADTPPAPLDVVTLTDGSVIYGEVVEMSGGELHIKTAFGVGDIVKSNGPTCPSWRSITGCRFI